MANIKIENNVISVIVGESEPVFSWKGSAGASGKYNGGGYLSMATRKIISLGTPTSSSDAITKEYVDNLF